MKRILGNLLVLVIILPAIGNAQAVNAYYPQQMRMAAPVMPYYMNSNPYAGRWNPWMMRSWVPMNRPAMYNPMMYRPGMYGRYPVAYYQPGNGIPRYPVPARANPYWRNYRAGTIAPNRAYRRFTGAPAYGYRAFNSYPVSQFRVPNYPPNFARNYARKYASKYIRQAPPVPQRRWRQVNRPGNYNQYRSMRNVPSRFIPGNSYVNNRKYAPAWGNHNGYPPRVRGEYQRYSNHWRHPAWRQNNHVPQRFIPRRYVIPASNPAIKPYAAGFRNTNAATVWGANPYTRNPVVNVQPKVSRPYRMAYDSFRR